MDRLFEVAKQPIDNGHFVVLLIGEPAVDQRHVGIWHCAEAGEPRVLHLAWHCRLENEAIVPQYFAFWVDPRFPLTRLRQVASYCRRVWRKNEAGGIPYAFSQPNAALDPATGAILLGPTVFGLTCASFVLAVFASAGMPLLDCTTWIAEREGDRQWQEEIVEKLAEHAEAVHIQHIKSEIGTVRFRPEDVAAATILAPPPAVFESAAPLGQQIVARIRCSAAAVDPRGPGAPPLSNGPETTDPAGNN
jgi:hypothetical protein